MPTNHFDIFKCRDNKNLLFGSSNVLIFLETLFQLIFLDLIVIVIVNCVLQVCFSTNRAFFQVRGYIRGSREAARQWLLSPRSQDPPLPEPPFVKALLKLSGGLERGLSQQPFWLPMAGPPSGSITRKAPPKYLSPPLSPSAVRGPVAGRPAARFRCPLQPGPFLPRPPGGSSLPRPKKAAS